jgi:UDPglucose 6-dehydrogenase
MNSYKVIVTKSTVPVGTGEAIREVVKKTQKTPIRFDMVSNPEFLREGSAIEDFMRPNRVVIGADSDQAVAIMKDLYRPLYLIETPIVVTDVPTAELIKYASNAFLATKISFINEIANLCERVGANVQLVAKGMGLDHRIGSKFLHALEGHASPKIWPHSFKPVNVMVIPCRLPPLLRMSTISNAGGWLKRSGMPSAE